MSIFDQLDSGRVFTRLRRRRRPTQNKSTTTRVRSGRHNDDDNSTGQAPATRSITRDATLVVLARLANGQARPVPARPSHWPSAQQVRSARSRPPPVNYSFLPCDAMLSAVGLLCRVVCLCVCMSHSGIVSKRLNVGSRK